MQWGAAAKSAVSPPGGTRALLGGWMTGCLRSRDNKTAVSVALAPQSVRSRTPVVATYRSIRCAARLPKEIIASNPARYLFPLKGNKWMRSSGETVLDGAGGDALSWLLHRWGSRDGTGTACFRSWAYPDKIAVTARRVVRSLSLGPTIYSCSLGSPTFEDLPAG